MNEDEFMLDLETGAVPESLPADTLVEVVEIGLVRFRETEVIDRLRLFPAVGNGLCSADTDHLFWMRRLAEGEPVPEWLRNRLDNRVTPMEECLRAVTKFIGWQGKPNIWTKGAFDLPILACHLAAARMPCPWKYWHARDLRTFIKEADVRVDRKDITAKNRSSSWQMPAAMCSGGCHDVPE